TVATASRQATRRGHARHTETRASSSASSAALAARSRTSSGVCATGVSGVAGSSGHPEPGRTVTASSRGEPPPEQVDGALPAVVRGLVVVHLGPRVVEERVLGTGVVEDLDVRARGLDGVPRGLDAG